MKWLSRILAPVLVVLLIVMALPLVTGAQDDQEVHIRESIIRVVEEGFNQGNVAVVDELFSPDYVAYVPGQEEPDTIEDFKADIVEIRTVMPDFTATADPIIVEGNWAAFRFTGQGTFTGAAEGWPPPTNAPVVFTANIILRFDEEGLAIEEWDEFDNLSFLIQTGAINPEELFGE